MLGRPGRAAWWSSPPPCTVRRRDGCSLSACPSSGCVGDDQAAAAAWSRLVGTSDPPRTAAARLLPGASPRPRPLVLLSRRTPAMRLPTLVVRFSGDVGSCKVVGAGGRGGMRRVRCRGLTPGRESKLHPPPRRSRRRNAWCWATRRRRRYMSRRMPRPHAREPRARQAALAPDPMRCAPPRCALRPTVAGAETRSPAASRRWVRAALLAATTTTTRCLQSCPASP